MPELTIQLTPAEKRRLDLAAAALGKSVDEMVADELRYRYELLTFPPDVRVLRIAPAQRKRGGALEVG